MQSLKQLAEHIPTIEIDQYIDGELAAGSGAELEDHLKTCIECRGEFRDRQILLLQLDSALGEAVSLPSGFARSIEELASSGPSIFGKKITSWSQLIVVWFAAFALLNPLGNWLSGNVGTSDRTSLVFRSALTEMGTLVNVVFSAAESIVAIVVLRFLSLL